MALEVTNLARLNGKSHFTRLGQVALLVASFGGVMVLKQIATPGWRLVALALWFTGCSILLKQIGKFSALPMVYGGTDHSSVPPCTSSEKEPTAASALSSPHCSKPATKLNENYLPVTWWGIPQTTTGVTFATLYAAVTLLVFTLNTPPDQWQGNFTNAILTTLSLEQLVVQSVIVPVYEEAFFRGALLSMQLISRGNKTSSQSFPQALWIVYLNALVFWLFHLPADFGIILEHLSQGSLPIPPGPFFLGLACATIALRDRTLLLAMVLHGLANASGPFWEPALRGTGLFELFYLN